MVDMIWSVRSGSRVPGMRNSGTERGSTPGATGSRRSMFLSSQTASMNSPPAPMTSGHVLPPRCFMFLHGWNMIVVRSSVSSTMSPRETIDLGFHWTPGSTENSAERSKPWSASARAARMLACAASSLLRHRSIARRRA